MKDAMSMITGVHGFVGQVLARRLQGEGRALRLVCRCGQKVDSSRVSVVAVDFSATTDWSAALSNVDCIVHAAGLAHVSASAKAFDVVNCQATLNLARQAAAAGVRRFIFISSVGVHGREGFDRRHPGNEEAAMAPLEEYAKSKAKTEVGLRQIEAETGLEVVIVRPVLMYGSGVKGNIQSMVKWLLAGVPLPLGLVKNRRSFLNVKNLADFVFRCLDHPGAAGESFILADGNDVSTPELLCLTGKALGKRPLLVPVPPALLRVGAMLLGKRKMAAQLLDDLCFDISKARTRIDWQPPFSMEDGLKDMADSINEAH